MRRRRPVPNVSRSKTIELADAQANLSVAFGRDLLKFVATAYLTGWGKVQARLFPTG